jgi:hypothetical protein
LSLLFIYKLIKVPQEKQIVEENSSIVDLKIEEIDHIRDSWLSKVDDIDRKKSFFYSIREIEISLN